jgi:hypothetical protein
MHQLQKLAPTAYEPVSGSADELAVLVRDDSAKYERLAKELKHQAEFR